MSRLMEYFNEVDKNAVMRAAHQTEPAATMTEFGLSASEQEAVVSGEALGLAKAVGIPLNESSALQVMHVPNTVYSSMEKVQMSAIMVPQSIAMAN